MTRAEMNRVLALVVVFYPYCTFAEEQVNAWHRLFGHHNFETLEAAMGRALLITQGPPKPAEVAREVLNVLVPEKRRPIAAEAWRMLVEASNCTGGWAKLPPIVRRVARRITTRVGLLYCENLDIIRAHFLRAYDQELEHVTNELIMPPALRETTKRLQGGGLRRLTQ